MTCTTLSSSPSPSPLACVAAPRAQDWNQWRGPSRSGVTAAFSPPAAWPDKPRKVWETTVGTGHSSPVVSGTRAFVFARVGDEEVVTAFDYQTGKQVWQQRYRAPYQVNPAAESHGKGPKSTPVVDGGRLFTLGISGTLSAFDAATGSRSGGRPSIGSSTRLHLTLASRCRRSSTAAR